MHGIRCAYLLCDLCLFGLHHLAHHGEHVLPALRICVRSIKVVESDVLDDFLLLVHIALRQRHVLFCFKVELCGVCI